MPHPLRRLARAAVLFLALFAIACGAAPPPAADSGAGGAASPSEVNLPAIAASEGAADPGFVATGIAVDAGAIPVTPADPQWGQPDAPVTIVVFGDFECPYCAKAAITVDGLKEVYGPAKLRIAFKHHPLAFHQSAEPAAQIGAAIQRLAGSAAFFAFHDELYRGLLDARESEPRASMEDLVGRAVVVAARRASLSAREIAREAADHGAAKVDEDAALAKKLGIRGTPSFYINGRFFSGAQPSAAFREIIDQELVLATRALAQGTPSSRLYAARVDENLAVEPPPGVVAADAAAKEDPTIWSVPVAGSPVKGPPDAPVTLVIFSDFECPFCAKVVPTLAEVERRYGPKVRFVWKHRPLPFHKRAEPASELAAEIRAKKGDAAFWKAHDALFLAQRSLDDGALGDIARDAGLDPTRALAAVRQKKHAVAIEADSDLAEDVEADGTPHFFINGKRLTGAQPIEKFASKIDAALVDAQNLVKKGTPRAKLYDEIIRDGKSNWPPARAQAPAVEKDTPVRGPAGAPLVVQVFSDFECPYCQRLSDSLDEVDQAMPGKLRIAFRHTPLPMHPGARPASILALEARRQKGDAGFWTMHDLIFGDQGHLDRPSLEARAAKLGLDLAEVRAALDGTRFDAVLDRDAALAKKLGFTGTPAMLVGDYVVEGHLAPPALARIVRAALKDRQKPGAKKP